jgi:two-component system phosphate regulon response regulator PhoB
MREAMADSGVNGNRLQILVVEDESALVEVLRYNLEREGFAVAAAADGEAALEAIADHKPDLLILDWMLTHISGLEICRQLRRRPETRDLPIIMLTARGEEADRVRGLEVGADDYVAKPFSPSELLARVRALLRRARPSTTSDLLTYAGVVMDLVSHRVLRDGRPVHLGPTEYRLLRFLMERPGRVYTREQLLDAVWGRDIYVEARTVDVHIRRLRKALNGPKDTDMIRTVRSAGYALDELSQ